MFSIKVAKPVPLNAPSVDAILVALDVELEFDLPEEVLPEGVLPEEFLPKESLVGEIVVLQKRALISSMRGRLSGYEDANLPALVPYAQGYRDSNDHDYKQKRSKQSPELPSPLQYPLPSKFL